MSNESPKIYIGAHARSRLAERGLDEEAVRAAILAPRMKSPTHGCTRFAGDGGEIVIARRCMGGWYVHTVYKL